mgnify:CR=1 FL=1
MALFFVQLLDFKLFNLSMIVYKNSKNEGFLLFIYDYYAYQTIDNQHNYNILIHSS